VKAKGFFMFKVFPPEYLKSAIINVLLHNIGAYIQSLINNLYFIYIKHFKV